MRTPVAHTVLDDIRVPVPQPVPTRDRQPLNRVELDAVLHALDPVDLRSPIVRRVAASGFVTEDVLSRLAVRLERHTQRTAEAPSSLVHLGCRSGGVGLWLAETERAQLIAVDPDRAALQQTMHACGTFDLAQFPSFQQASFDTTRLPTACAHAVTSCEALYLAAYPRDALEEVHRILADGGVLLFDAYVADDDPCATGWVHALQHAGFDLLDIDDQSAHWRSVTRQQHLARIEYTGYLVERLGQRRAHQEAAASRAMLSVIETTRRIELVARRRRIRFARSSSRVVAHTQVVPTTTLS